MQGCWWRRSTVKAGRQSLLPHPVFDEDSMYHKQRLVTAVGASVQGEDLRRLLTVITNASFKKRACKATRFTTVANIRSVRLFWLQFSAKNCMPLHASCAAPSPLIIHPSEFFDDDDPSPLGPLRRAVQKLNRDFVKSSI